LDVDARGIVFYSFFAPPKKLGAGQFYLAAYLDGAGQRLRGSFGPKAPNGMEANWVPTVDGSDWFPYFRLYGPQRPFFAKTWRLGDIEKIS
jgi:hypothetical protein